ncbi:MAG: hypothetical protein AAFV45_04330 [Pseudomonadota bacterium]
MLDLPAQPHSIRGVFWRDLRSGCLNRAAFVLVTVALFLTIWMILGVATFLTVADGVGILVRGRLGAWFDLVSPQMLPGE